MVPILLIPVIGFVAANPLPDALDNRLVSQIQKALSRSAESRLDTMHESPNKMNKMMENINKTQTVLPKRTSDRLRASGLETTDGFNEFVEKRTIGRKHKAIFVDYPLIPHYPRVPAYEVDDSSEITTKDRLSGESERYQESDIFYIRLPPTPYMFVPGLGYISQPPAYSTAALKPQISLIAQTLPQLSPHMRPTVRPQPAAAAVVAAASQQTVNPFIKLPIDFVSNGKPTSVYQWQKKPGKKPTDSPITNLDELSAGFVSNGKPTSVYQWQANLKPAKRPDNSLNSLDMGPYTFNGKLTGVYLLGADGSSSVRQPIRYPDYQDNYQATYY
ncbi:uncharacterized protein LOC109864120 [Pseudomyrmex gracilis]|uniref:uncharacterized protein LOC109864120 n=1 Tax=Pseudomyrmex gracilis TaxID=219809 RepID=UPI000994F242|nr:uncharacterized protein LOC109864120 [Pseudomyrmex gracilis]